MTKTALIAASFVIALSLPQETRAQSTTPQAGTVDFTVPILDITGKPVPDDGTRQSDDPTCAKCDPMSAGKIVARCLVSDDKATPEQKPAMWFLAKRIMDNKAATLTPEEIHAIKQCVGKMSPIVAGQIDPLVDPTFKPDPIK